MRINVWRPVDWQGQIIHRLWTHLWQVRTGVLMVDGSLLLIAAKPWVAPTEQLFIYQMSAVALLIGGVGVIITAMLALETSDTAEDVEDLVREHDQS